MRYTYGKFLPEMNLSDLSGKLIVIEGYGRVRGAQPKIDLLKPWLRNWGTQVSIPAWRARLWPGDGIRRAKEGNN